MSVNFKALGGLLTFRFIKRPGGQRHLGEHTIAAAKRHLGVTADLTQVPVPTAIRRNRYMNFCSIEVKMCLKISNYVGTIIIS